MKRLMVWLILGGMSLWLAQGFAQTPGGGEYAAKATKRDQAAVVDGVADKDEYPATPLVLKQTPERGSVGGDPASARVFHDGQTLFVCLTVLFKADSALSRGESWGTDDGAEVCFRDASGDKPGSTFIVHGFATGKHECSTEGGVSGEAAQKLEKAVKFAAKVDKQSWTGEWAIPLSAAGLTYKPGLKLGFNLGVWRSSNYEWIAWRGTQDSNYELDSAGTLTLE